MRKVLPISLILTVALLGCTMNHNPGNGQPVTATPSMSPATTPGTSYGNTPMSSSYAAPATSNVSRADQAAAIMREHQLYQPRFLGYLNPQPRVQQTAQSYDNGQLSYPQMANPELTVNSSISSGPYPVIGTGAVVLSGTTGAATVATTGTTSATSATGTTAATLAPTLASGATVSPNVASSGLPSMASASGGTTTTTNTATTASSTASASRLGTTRLALPTSSQAMTAPLTVTATPSGRVLITNVRR